MADKKDSVTVKCLNCGKEFTGKSQRAQFCSGACKVQFFRNKRKGDIVTPNREDVTENTGKHNEDVTVTDQLFIDDAAKRGLINWYVFHKEVFDRKCLQCRKLFQTRLSLNKYCSPKCRDIILTRFTGEKA